VTFPRTEAEILAAAIARVGVSRVSHFTSCDSESQQAPHSLASNPHRLTPLPTQKTPRFPPSRLFGRLPPCIPSRLRPAGIRKPLTIAAIHLIDVGPAGSIQSGSLSKGALNRRWRKATEFALEEPGKGNRTAIFQVPANDLHADRETALASTVRHCRRG
jgi:hypothetical protein